jgi:glycosyltransferase involved in cell wall biosynthesis
MNKYHNSTIIHASNVNGLGARQVVSSFIENYLSTHSSEVSKVIVPSNGYGFLKKLYPKKILFYNRFVPNSISRFMECYLSKYFFEIDKNYIVLGDIPLWGIDNQVVLVHQSNLVKPSVDPLSSTSLKFKVNRLLFNHNLKFVKNIVVQSGVMKKNLELSYPVLQDKILVNPQPVPSSIRNRMVQVANGQERALGPCVKLFYPSAGYPHKNHRFLLNLVNIIPEFELEVQVSLTLTDKEYEPFKQIPWIVNLGRLNSKEMITEYQKHDGLLFLSYAESFGLPLLEAMYFGLPIIAPDLPYAKWMCEDQAVYFNYDKGSFQLALSRFINDYSHLGNYTTAMEKFPSDWDEVTSYFREVLLK